MILYLKEDVEVQSTNDSGSEEGEDDLAGTEHYIKVNKSKLLKPEEVALGPKYSKSRISREALLNDDNEDEEEGSESELIAEKSTNFRFADPEDSDLELDVDQEEIDSDEALGESNEEKFKDFTFRGSGKPREPAGSKKRPTASDFMSESEDEDNSVALNGDDSDETDEDVLDVSDQHSEDSDADEESDNDQNAKDDTEEDKESESNKDAQSENKKDENERRAELRKIIGKEQQSVVASITKAAKANAAKGNAVKKQRKAFDSLLSVRMVLQKALIASNSMSTVKEKDSKDSSNQLYKAAKEANIKL
ncbi:hypothetical protein IFR05_011263 [Cadophora sp. M221]|nr:hypothetical protein IFR05_011263 [Cadophora sp. M221]